MPGYNFSQFLFQALIQMNGAWKMVAIVGVWTQDLLTTTPRLLIIEYQRKPLKKFDEKMTKVIYIICAKASFSCLKENEQRALICTLFVATNHCK